LLFFIKEAAIGMKKNQLLTSLLQKKEDKMSISIPRERELYGVKIRKLPNGAYIKALQTIQNLPALLIEKCFPGMDVDDILKQLSQIDKDGFLALVGHLMSVLPAEIFKLISTLLDIPLEKLMDELTPAETLEILEAYWEVNDLTPFFERLKRITGNLIQPTNQPQQKKMP